MDQAQQPQGNDSLASFFTSPISNQISKRHQFGLVQATTAPNNLPVSSTQYQSNNDMMQLAGPNNFGMMSIQTQNNPSASGGNYNQYMGLLSKKDSLSSRSDMKYGEHRQRRNQYDMSQTHVGFVSKTGDYTSKQQVLSKERHLKHRISKEITLSPRSQTAFGYKASHQNLVTPSSQKLNESGIGHINT